MNEPLLKVIFNEKLNGVRDVIIYGAGVNARRLLSQMTWIQPAFSGNVICIADKDESKHDRNILDIPIVSIDALSDYERSIPVLITPERNTQEITQTLIGLGFSSLFYFNGESYHSAAAIAAQPAADLSLYDESKIAAVEKMLSDDKSKAVFRAKLDSWFKCEHIALERLVEYDQYFVKGIINLGQKEVFADCGMMDGGTILDFVNRVGDWEYIYGYEPIPVSYELSRSELQSRRIKNMNIYPFAVGASNEITTMTMSSNNIGAHKISSYEIVSLPDFPNGGNVETIQVEMRSLDGIDMKHIPTFIKMDIEGGELDALNGAAGIIRENRPKLAISAYHHPSHLYEIPLLIKEFYPDYRIYFRQHSLYFETVCYAV